MYCQSYLDIHVYGYSDKVDRLVVCVIGFVSAKVLQLWMACSYWDGTQLAIRDFQNVHCVSLGRIAV